MINNIHKWRDLIGCCEADQSERERFPIALLNAFFLLNADANLKYEIPLGGLYYVL